MRIKPDYKIADKKAPRFRIAKYRHSFINKDLYEKFIEDNPNYYISYADFKLVIETINLEIVNHVINNREGVFLPKNIGRIWLGLWKDNKELKKQKRRLSESGLLMYNDSIEILTGKICWDYKMNFTKPENHEFYAFRAHRDFKKAASKAFKETPELYARSEYSSRKHEYYKSKKLEENERNQLNDQVSDQSDKDSSQIGEFGFENNE